MRCCSNKGKLGWLFILFFIFQFNFTARSQQNKLDALISEYESTTDPAKHVEQLYGIAYRMKNTDPHTSLEYADKGFKLAVEQNNGRYIGNYQYIKAKIYRQIGEKETAQQFIDLAIQQFKDIAAKDRIANALNEKGWLLYSKGEFDDARNQFTEALTICKEINNNVLIAVNLNDIGVTYYEEGVSEKAAEYYLKSAKIREENKDRHGLMKSYNNLGILYKQRDKYDQAIEYYNKGLEIALDLDDKIRVTTYYNNIGNIFQKKEDYKKAEEFYLKGLKIAERMDAKSRVAQFNFVLGVNESYNGKYKQSIKYLEESLAQYKALNEKPGIAKVLLELGNAYVATGRGSKGLEYMLSAEQIAEDTDYGQMKTQVIADISTAYSKMGEYENAFNYQLKYNEHLEKKQIKEKDKLVVELQAQYEAEYESKARQKEIATLSMEKEHQQSQLYTSIALAALLALVVFLLFFMVRQQKRANSQLEEKQLQILNKNQALEDTNRELKIAKEAAEAAAVAKEEFLSTMSHEIRTPMNAVVGMTNILLDEEPRDDQIENLKTLKFSANNLLSLINDILDFSKIESGKITLEKVDFKLDEMLKGITETLKVTSEKKQLSLKLDYDDNGLQNALIGDPTRFTQIFTNLIGNAIKFTPQGSVTLISKIKEITDKDATIYFAVKDTGIGIPEDRREVIFDSFTQAMNSTTRLYGGTGLGLAITKRLVELYDAKISVDSELGVGSTFYFTLTLPLGGRLVEDLPSQKGVSLSKVGLEGIRILMAEDNKINQIVASKILKKWKVQLDIANDGLEAIEKMKVKDYDVVLMDIHMPNMDGYDATEAIRAMEGRKGNTPIIALTASAFSTVAEKAKAIGMDDHLGKPFKPDELFDKIIQSIASRSQIKRQPTA